MAQKPSKNEVILRFVAFGNRLVGSSYGWKKKYADALKMTPQQLNSILAEDAPVGASIRERLQELGCDIDWLMTGSNATERGKLPVSQEGLLMLEKLRAMGIDSLAKLETFCDPKDIATDVAVLLRERMAVYKTKKHKHQK